MKSREKDKISTELVEQVTASLAAKRIDLPPSGKAALVRHLCAELLSGGEEPLADEDAVLVDLDRLEKVIFQVETWLDLNRMEIHPMDKAELVRSICEKTVKTNADVKALVRRSLAVYAAGEEDVT
ncbi:MAG: hypothetical protein GYA56_08755 [Geobacteraceae bacterium]|nr:hypothetical protein [Geobacteraceae bacterium]